MELRVENIKRYFNSVKALDDVSFVVPSGAIYGFVGPNGAGKTTTLRITAMLDHPMQGEVYLDGRSIEEAPEFFHRHIGFMPDSLPDNKDIIVSEYLDFFGRAYGLPYRLRREIMDKLSHFLSLDSLLDKDIRSLSKGMKQRVSLARTLMHDPDVLLLDEPAAGLDPRARVEIRMLLKLLGEQGKTMLISSHILSELEEICDGIIIIQKGKIKSEGSISTVSSTPRKSNRVYIRILTTDTEVKNILAQSPGVKSLRQLNDNQFEVDVDGGEEETVQFLKYAIERGLSVVEFRPLHSKLESMFLAVTENS